MRKEFKFRAWNTKESKWMFGYEYPELGGFSLLGEVVLTGQLSSISLEDLDDVEIMQFTGIRDKNDREIYEGDIVKLSAKSCSERLGCIDKEWITTVEWNDIRCCFEAHHKPRNLTWTFGGRDFNGKLYVKEIIGNVHENPELLS